MLATEPTTVTVTLSSTPYTLVPILPTMKTANRLLDGFTPLFRVLFP